MDIESKVNYYSSLSFNELEKECGYNYQKVFYYVKENYPKVNPNHLLVGIIFTSIASDGKFSEGEWKFVRSFIGGYSYEEAFTQIQGFYNEEAKIIAKDVLRKLPYDIKDALINVIVSVLCVDGRNNSYEEEFINKIL